MRNRRGSRRIGFLPILCLLFLALLAISCSDRYTATYRVFVLGFRKGGSEERRNTLLDYACRRAESGLGVEVEMGIPEKGEGVAGLLVEEAASCRLLISFESTAVDLPSSSGSEDASPYLVYLDYPHSSAPAGRRNTSYIRYKVEEGSYICGFLAGWLTGGTDHPLTNPASVVAFIGSAEEPRTAWYQAGFTRGARAAAPGINVLSYLVGASEDKQKARAFAEEAVKKGADIIFCAPGAFDVQVVRVAESKNVLVILTGGDRSEESPEHVLTSLILRDDNAVFRAVNSALRGELTPGMQEWGIKEGVWSLASFRGHDVHIRRELKEALRREQEKVSGMIFSP